MYRPVQQDALTFGLATAVTVMAPSREPRIGFEWLRIVDSVDVHPFFAWFLNVFK